MSDRDIALIAHLIRRAGFGAAKDDLESYASKGYEATVEELLDISSASSMAEDLIRRYHHDQSAAFEAIGSGANWLYRMITTNASLQEKMVLFWHSVFATGYAKVPQGKVLMDQLRMFRRYGMGSFRTLLVELSRDPAMIIWLDNQDNHKGAINENYGRELLELFSMGVGSYSERDIKECARAFTGWTVANTEYSQTVARRNSIWPYGKIAWRFEYRAEDHDDGEKEFLGEIGRFDGGDIIDIICRQPATAKFLSRHLYHFFVADEPPVPQWPYTPPRDPAAIDLLSQAYFDSNYDLAAMLKALFLSDFFRSEEVRYAKIKNPVELVAGVLRLSGEFDRPRREIIERTLQMTDMGQQVLNPPSVEGWHQGLEWIDSGTLVQRLNFATEQLSNRQMPGVRAMADAIEAGGYDSEAAERLVEACLEQLGGVRISDETRSVLVSFAEGEEGPEEARDKIPTLLGMVASTPEFQRA